VLNLPDVISKANDVKY